MIYSLFKICKKAGKIIIKLNSIHFSFLNLIILMKKFKELLVNKDSNFKIIFRNKQEIYHKKIKAILIMFNKNLRMKEKMYHMITNLNALIKIRCKVN